MKEREVIFWDFDGVIKESVAVKTQGYVRLFESFGAKLAERVRQHHEAHGGVSRYEKIPVYLAWAGQSASSQQVEEYCDRFSALVLRAVVDSPWVPGVREYLQRHRTGQHFVLITATPDAEIRQILAELGIAGCFREVYGASMPKWEAIRTVLERLRCPASLALVVGDSTTDFEAAARNDVEFLLRCTPENKALQQRHTGLKFETLTHE